jgi:hypothetical protein
MAYPPIQRQALNILHKSTEAVLGVESAVSRAIDRAIKTELQTDLTLAGLAFDSLPGTKRKRIGQAADMHSRVFRKMKRRQTGALRESEKVVAALQQLGMRRVTIAKPWTPKKQLGESQP